LGEDHSSIGVVALGPDQFLYQDWFEFEPAFKEYFAQDPTYTTVRPKRLRRKQVALGDAFRETAEAYFSSLPHTGEAAGYYLLLAPALIPSASLFKAAIGQFEWVQPRPIVQPLNSVKDLRASIPTGSLSKKSLAAAIADQVIHISQDRSDRQFLEVPFEQVRERSLRAAGVDGLITVRVQSVDLIADDSNDPEARLSVHVWTNFNRSMASPFAYVSEKRRVSEWGADSARLIRKETALAAESLALQIIDTMFPTASPIYGL
jgi:hypothetical protein